jgi:hypothetical protein
VPVTVSTAVVILVIIFRPEGTGDGGDGDTLPPLNGSCRLNGAAAAGTA